MIEHKNIIGKVNKIMQSSKGMIKFIRALELTIRILWKKHYLKVVHDEGYKYNEHCCMRYFHDFTSCIGCF